MTITDINESIKNSGNSDLTSIEYDIVMESLENLESRLGESWQADSSTDSKLLIPEISKTIKSRLKSDQLNEGWIEDFDNLFKNLKQKAKKKKDKVLKKAVKIFDTFKSKFKKTYKAFVSMASQMKLNKNQFFNALRQANFYKAWKEAKKMVLEGTADLYVLYKSAYEDMSDVVFGGLAKTEIGKKLKEGSKAIDEFIVNNPEAKYVIGPAIAYTLYYIWTQMTFKGDFEYDFDWTNNFKALKGDFDVTEIFAGQDGVELLAWFGIGMSGILPSAPWLDGALSSYFGGLGNHILAVLLTFILVANSKYPDLFDFKLFKLVRYKLCQRDNKLQVEKKTISSMKNAGVKLGVYRKASSPCS